MEPPVVYPFDIARLLHTCKRIVDGVNQILIVTDDTQLASRDVGLVKLNAINVQLLNLHHQWLFAPHVVLVLATSDTHQGLAG